ncbi:MAG TPA: hypothetical protein EYP60_00050 [bacterium (Candidatus Stahlbacteria)]|nr:hypothetical protein [Candidatus Stahlbacteria bacterium]
MKVGIPRCLFYHEYFSIWETFFSEVGVEIVVSPDTTKAILKRGLNLAHTDICLPMKIAFGHVDYLKDKVDVIFLPRIVSIEKHKYVCPKAIGFTDMVRAVVEGLPPILDPIFDTRKQPLKHSYYALGKKFGKSRTQVDRILKTGEKAKKEDKKEIKVSGNGLSVAIISRSYLINDNLASFNLISRLEEKGITVWTADMVDNEIIKIETSTLKKSIYYSLGERSVGAAFHFFRSSLVDGLLYLLSFDCGPDALLKEFIDEEAKKSSIPYMTLIVDEHTGIEGILTRVEAFLDMVIRKKNESSFSTYGRACPRSKALL